MEAQATPTSDARSGTAPAHVLVVPNETVGGNKLLEAIRQRAGRGPIRCTVICPQNQPRKGLVIHERHGSIGGPDPSRPHDRSHCASSASRRPARSWTRTRFSRSQDAVGLYHPDEIIISTHPYPRSGLLRRDLIERIESASGLPVEHVVVDLQTEPVKHTLVVANETVGERPLIEALERRASRVAAPVHDHLAAGRQEPGGGRDRQGPARAHDRRVAPGRARGGRSDHGDRSPDQHPERASVPPRRRDHRLDLQGTALDDGSGWTWSSASGVRPGAAWSTSRWTRLSTGKPPPRRRARQRSWKLPPTSTLTLRTRRSPTRARGSTRSCSASCFSSSRRRCCSGRSSPPTSSCGLCRTRRGRRSRSTSRSTSLS